MKKQLSIFYILLILSSPLVFGQTYLQLKDRDDFDLLINFYLITKDNEDTLASQKGKMYFSEIAKYKHKTFNLDFVNGRDRYMYKFRIDFPTLKDGKQYYISSGKITYEKLKRNKKNYFYLKERSRGLNTENEIEMD